MKFPHLYEIEQSWERTQVTDLKSTLHSELERSGIAKKIKKGMRIAITAGSRGVANMAEIIRLTIEELNALGGEPFIIPTMGSHGGATAEGQIEILRELGITEEKMGVPIRSTMEVVKIGETERGMPVFLDRYAAQADGIVVVNRVKKHTDYTGPIESGLMKMIVIGLGKHRQALEVHQYGARGLREYIPEVARVVLEKTPILFGIATIENAYHETAKLMVLRPEEMEEGEKHLLLEANRLMPRLPFDDIDILLIQEIGKTISGAGMDTNIIGRYRVPGEPEPIRPRIDLIIVLDLIPESHGNAVGIGLADLTVRRLTDKIDRPSFNANCITSGFLERGKVPITLETDYEALETAFMLERAKGEGKIRFVWIKNTLALDRVFISESLLEEARKIKNVKVINGLLSLKFTPRGELVSPF